MIENQPNEITLIYHSDKAEDRKARAFVETITGYIVKTLDLKRDRLTETQLAEIVHKMNAEFAMLFDSTYKDRFKAGGIHDITSASDSDLLTILTNEPILINTPITIIGKRAYTYAAAYELLTKKTEDKESKPNNIREQRIVF